MLRRLHNHLILRLKFSIPLYPFFNDFFPQRGGFFLWFYCVLFQNGILLLESYAWFSHLVNFCPKLGNFKLSWLDHYPVLLDFILLCHDPLVLSFKLPLHLLFVSFYLVVESSGSIGWLRCFDFLLQSDVRFLHLFKLCSSRSELLNHLLCVAEW